MGAGVYLFIHCTDEVSLLNVGQGWLLAGSDDREEIGSNKNGKKEEEKDEEEKKNRNLLGLVRAVNLVLFSRLLLFFY